MASFARRRSLMTAALGFMQLQSFALAPREIRVLARWMNSWTGLGAVVVGMRAQESDLELKEFPYGWRATFYPIGIAHLVVEGSAFEPTPWAAVQKAAWAALMAQDAPKRAR